MRAGACPCCNVELKFIFGDPEVEAAVGGWHGLKLERIEEHVERFGYSHRDSEGIARIAASCPGCHGLFGLSWPVGDGHPVDVLGRPVRPVVDYGLEVVA